MIMRKKGITIPYPIQNIQFVWQMYYNTKKEEIQAVGEKMFFEPTPSLPAQNDTQRDSVWLFSVFRLSTQRKNTPKNLFSKVFGVGGVGEGIFFLKSPFPHSPKLKPSQTPCFCRWEEQSEGDRGQTVPGRRNRHLCRADPFFERNL